MKASVRVRKYSTHPLLAQFAYTIYSILYRMGIHVMFRFSQYFLFAFCELAYSEKKMRGIKLKCGIISADLCNGLGSFLFLATAHLYKQHVKYSLFCIIPSVCALLFLFIFHGFFLPASSIHQVIAFMGCSFFIFIFYIYIKKDTKN